MPSARAASLAAQRNRYASKNVSYKAGSLGSSASSIASKTVKSQYDIYKKQYDDGLITNDFYLNFLQETAQSPYLAAKDIENVMSDYRDTAVEINVEKMQSIYDLADESEKPSIAQTISNYYQEYANSLEADTPAQSKFLQKVSDWDNKAIIDEQSFMRSQRKLARAQNELEIENLPADSVEALQQKAQIYKEYAQQAQADGDQVESLNYQTKAQKALNDIPVLQEKMQNQSNKELRNNRLDVFRQIQNDYHDGKLTIDDAFKALNLVNDAALQEGDTSLQLSVNTFADTLQKDREKDIQTGDSEGVEFMIKKPGGSSATSTIKKMKEEFANEDDVYKQTIEHANKIGDISKRTKIILKVTADYLYGAAPNEDDPTGWNGLMFRQQFYDDLNNQLPGKGYGDLSRDASFKEESIRSNLGVIADQYQKIFGDAGAEVLKDVIANLPSQYQPLTNGEGLRLVKTDELGKPYEEFVNELPKDAILIPGSTNRYTTLKGYYAPGTIPGTDLPQIEYAEFDGRIWVKDNNGDLVPAAEAAGANKDIATWYESMVPREQQLKAEYDQNQPPPPTPEEQNAIARDTFRTRPDVQENVLNNALGNKPPLASGKTLAKAPTASFATQDKINQQSAQEALDVIGPTQAITTTSSNVAKLPTPSNDVQLPKTYNYQPIQQQLQPTTVQSGYTPSPSVNQQIKSSNALTTPSIGNTPLQQSGLKLNLGQEYAPVINQPKINLLDSLKNTVSSGVNKVKNWFTNLF